MIIYNRVYLHLEKFYALSKALVKVKLRLDAWSMHRKGPILNFDLDLIKLTVKSIQVNIAKLILDQMILILL